MSYSHALVSYRLVALSRDLAGASRVAGLIDEMVCVEFPGLRPRHLQQDHHLSHVDGRNLGPEVHAPESGNPQEVLSHVAMRLCPVAGYEFGGLLGDFCCFQNVNLSNE